ncbi:MAG: dioxygenase [Burkholderiales bacterium]|nr:dioxygenase [Burkholderiales bacterium]
MKDIRLDNLTPAVVASFAGVQDERQRELLQQLVRHLHAYATATQLTHAEWRAALAFLHRVGDISSASRSEFSLLSDVLGLSSLVDLLGSVPGATPGSVLGPFHTVGSPWRANPADLTDGNAGEVVLLRGRVLDILGQPLPQATIDFWQNAANGLYWQMDDTQPQDNLRCQMQADAAGRFSIRTIRPQPYQIPTDGPAWHDVVGPAGRSAWRPAHYHLIVQSPGHRTLVTEVFDAADPYLESDAVFGVRAALVRPCVSVDDADVPVMSIDIVLAVQPA